MIADDSAVIRGLTTRALEAEPDIEVVASVPDGRMAVAQLERTVVDVIVLDVEMPNMDGLTAIPHLLKVAPLVKIVMSSTLTVKNAETSMKAMQAGAADCLPKPTATRDMLGAADFNRMLVEKVRSLGQAAQRGGSRARTVAARGTPSTVPMRPVSTLPRALPPARPMPVMAPKIIAIGSSTGGPQALFEVLKHLAGTDCPPIMLTQHMPPTFTTILADHIQRQCGIPTIEVQDGTPLQRGRVHVAPGDFHMTVSSDGGTLHIDKNPPENFCRPAVDPMLRSVVAAFGPRVLTLILTGMGSDGLKGCGKVVESGGAVLAQDEATSVVWGMPGAVATAGLCSAVLPLTEIGPRLKALATARAA
ncbi:protein-glutamate methylesterase/protein-glutamine glutaminase [Roseiterribacter gracilis]|uniref:Protein-glutamate methylesterase/protein-glutamine glutaminase n=1 Tax=Roseiterribacter gracilis TaxID=2812848 RepID=A0A8S8XJN4_9PROT|nr:chemotaxis response regulator protein-glutamate methylesterase 1 [Rhodospirillales bacterium TMPK1]